MTTGPEWSINTSAISQAGASGSREAGTAMLISNVVAALPMVMLGYWCPVKNSETIYQRPHGELAVDVEPYCVEIHSRYVQYNLPAWRGKDGYRFSSITRRKDRYVARRWCDRE